MSHTKVKTRYSVQGNYASTEIVDLYCHHNHTSDSVIFYDQDGDIQEMVFNTWTGNDDLFDAMQRLYSPYVSEWGRSALVEKVELLHKFPWE